MQISGEGGKDIPYPVQFLVSDKDAMKCGAADNIRKS